MANINIGGRLHSAATGNTVAGANEILDDNLSKKQDVINAEQSQAIGAEVTRATAAEQALQTDVNGIKSKIPSTASSSNKLADKNFVNSSIASNTANFKGTFNSLAELQAVTGATNNDYGFVKADDGHGNVVYKRYKYNGTSWIYEYDLNNSSFTEAQWNAINSGITEEMVEKLNELPDNEELEENLSGIVESVNAESERARSAERANAQDIQQLRNDIANAGGVGGMTLVEVTYDQLARLVSRSQLVPGRYYRITDYCTYVKQDNCAMIGHEFDIVVMALSANVLDEHAKAMPHSGSTYFDDCHMESWELKYSINNHARGWSWGNPVLKIRETGQLFYDDVNDPSEAAMLHPMGSYAGLYTKGAIDVGHFTNIDHTDQLVSDGQGAFYHYVGGTETEVLNDSDVQVIKPRGVITWMKDEYGNEAPYDFKSVRFRTSALNVDEVTTGDDAIDADIRSTERRFFSGEQLTLTIGSVVAVYEGGNTGEYLFTFDFEDNDEHPAHHDFSRPWGNRHAAHNIIGDMLHDEYDAGVQPRLPRVVLATTDTVDGITGNRVMDSEMVFLRPGACGNTIINCRKATLWGMNGSSLIECGEIISTHLLNNVGVTGLYESAYVNGENYLDEDSLNEYLGQ